MASHLEIVYEARNRIAHHEAVLDPRLHSLLESITFVTENYGSSNPCAHDSTVPEGLLTEVQATRAMVSRFSISASA